MDYDVKLTALFRAQIGDMAETFVDCEAARAWLLDIQVRVAWMDRISLLSLVTGRHPLWGRRGSAYMTSYIEGHRTNSLARAWLRALTYIGAWMCTRDWPVHRDQPNRFPLDLAGLIVYVRPLHKYPIPAAKMVKGTIVSATWELREDGYYWFRLPDLSTGPLKPEYWAIAGAASQVPMLIVDGWDQVEASPPGEEEGSRID